MVYVNKAVDHEVGFWRSLKGLGSLCFFLGLVIDAEHLDSTTAGHFFL